MLEADDIVGAKSVLEAVVSLHDVPSKEMIEVMVAESRTSRDDLMVGFRLLTDVAKSDWPSA